MKTRITAAALSAALLTPALIASPAAADEVCRPGADVRVMVKDLVTSIQDDVRSQSARAATRLALVESVRTFRGARADTAAERKGLGKEISAYARQLGDAENQVERKALVAAILALTEQRHGGPNFTAEERKELRGAIADLRRAIVKRADTAAEGRKYGHAISAIVQQLSCKPA
jgi:septal ring factor EnvC (AmiA/AmiB activator)